MSILCEDITPIQNLRGGRIPADPLRIQGLLRSSRTGSTERQERPAR